MSVLNEGIRQRGVWYARGSVPLTQLGRQASEEERRRGGGGGGGKAWRYHENVLSRGQVRLFLLLRLLLPPLP